MGNLCNSSKKKKQDFNPISNNVQNLISSSSKKNNENPIIDEINKNQNLIQPYRPNTNLVNESTNNLVINNNKLQSSDNRHNGINSSKLNNPITSPNNQITNYANSEIRCNECSYDFSDQNEFQSHFSYCNMLKRTQPLNNRIQQIMNLMQSLNERVVNRINKIDKKLVLIDWECITIENGVTLWRNIGKIKIRG